MLKSLVRLRHKEHPDWRSESAWERLGYRILRRSRAAIAPVYGGPHRGYYYHATDVEIRPGVWRQLLRSAAFDPDTKPDLAARSACRDRLMELGDEPGADRLAFGMRDEADLLAGLARIEERNKRAKESSRQCELRHKARVAASIAEEAEEVVCTIPSDLDWRTEGVLMNFLRGRAVPAPSSDPKAYRVVWRRGFALRFDPGRLVLLYKADRYKGRTSGEWRTISRKRKPLPPEIEQILRFL